MIGLTSHKIAVDPIFFQNEIESHNALTSAEKEFLISIGQTPNDSTPVIQIPDSAIKKCNQGIVRYVGASVEEEFNIHIGDYVLFSGYTGTTVRLEGEGLLVLMNAEFVTCKILPPETDIPGLYFRDASGQFWTATHEMAIDMIRRTFEENGALDVKASRPETFTRGGT